MQITSAKGITRPDEWNEKARDSIAVKMLEGTWRGGFQSNVKGRYSSVKCRKQNPRFISSLELIMHFIFDHDSKVEWYDYEAFRIPYKKEDGTKHDYYPDFLVKYQGDDRIHIIETKCWKNKDSLDVQTKQKAADDYAEEHNMTYTIMFDEDVHAMGVLLKDIIDLPTVVLDK